MNSKAFFSSIFLVAFCAFLLRLSSLSAFGASALDSSLNSAIALELSSLERFSLEQNTDFLIGQTIEQQALKKQLSPVQIIQAVNSNLSAHYSSLSSRGTVFRKTEFEFKDYLLLSGGNSIPFSHFNGEFSANSVRLSKGLYLVEVSYSGGLSGKTLAFSGLGPELQENYFLIPFNYTIRRLVVS